MGSYYAKPPLLRPEWGHPILRDQTCWFSAYDKSRAPADILIRQQSASAMQTNATYGNGPYGSGFLLDGSSTGYLDLGSSNRFLPSDTSPFSIGWIERYDSAAANSIGSLFGIFPTSAAKQFVATRLSQDTATSSTYGRFFCGSWTTTADHMVCWINVPRLDASTGITRACLLTGTSGTASFAPAAYLLYMDAALFTPVPSGVTGNSGNLGATANYFGWDNADTKWNGLLDNLRIWPRVLSSQEREAYFADPYVGAYRSNRNIYLFAATAFTGTLKTANTVARANIKTMDGITSANLKTANGLTA